MEQTFKKPHKLYTMFNAPKGKKVKHGTKEYTYKYMDKETKEIKETTENTFEKIQSYGGMCDYKKRIKEGTLLANDEGNFGDVSELQMDTVDAVLLSEFLAGLSESEISAILQQRNATNIQTNETEQTISQTNEQTNEDQSTNTSIDTTTNGGE